MGFDNIVIWLKKVFQDDIILPVNMSELLYKGKSDILLNLNNMQWSEIIENSERCIIVDIWAEAMNIKGGDFPEWYNSLNVSEKKEYEEGRLKAKALHDPRERSLLKG